ncbi:MAG: hypothetical protein ABJ092_03420 [Gillisia sp.]
MKHRVRILISISFIFLLMSCGPGRSTAEGDVVRTAIDVPDLFEAPPGMAWGDNTCKNPIIDPMDGSELILVQSRDGMGDYRVSGFKYGVNRGELLRINCNTGAVIGIVKRP